ncbi:hypothetical protein D3C76_1030750 [compost metagenome]
MDQVGDQQVDRRPRCIEESEQAVAGEKLTNLREILQGLGRIASGAAQVALECSGEDAAVKVHVEAVADPDQHAGADHFQRGHQQEQTNHQQGQHRKRRDVATDQGPIINLQHVHGRRQHHHVDDTAEPCQRVKTAAQAKERVGQFGAGARLSMHFGHTYPNAGCPCGQQLTVDVGGKQWMQAASRYAGGSLYWRLYRNLCDAPVCSRVDCVCIISATVRNNISLYSFF